MPVRGSVVRLYGQESQAPGSTDKGISIRARPGAQVVAPFDGKIAYAGPFRGYGLILIIDHGGRYHTILAGFDRIDAVVGQWVLSSEEHTSELQSLMRISYAVFCFKTIN